MKMSLVEIVKGIKNIETQETPESLIVKEKPRLGRPSKQIKLSKCIELSEENLEALGIFLAEGTTINDYNRIELGNTEPLLLKRFLKLLEMLGITRNEIKAKIGIFYENSYFNTNESAIKKFWSQRLKIPLTNFQKITWYHQKGNKKKTSPYGVVQLRVYHKLLTKIFNKILQKVSNLVLVKKSLAIPFLRGIFSGEGCIDKRKDSIHSVIVSCVKYKELIKKLLIKCDINPGKYNPRMRGFPIRRIENFKKIYEMQLLKIHPTKSEKFTNAIKNHRYFYRISSIQRESPKSMPSSNRGL